MHAPFFSIDGVSEIDALLSDDEKDAILTERDRLFPPIHYASLPATAQRALATDIAAEAARLAAIDDDPEPPF